MEYTLNCKRNDSDRKIVFILNEDNGIAGLWVDYTKPNFWNRLVNGVRYIFGKDKGIDYIILGKEHSYQLQKVATFLKGKKNKNVGDK